MKEFVNKLIERLEEESYEIQLDGAVVASTKTVVELSNAKKIVNQLAEEYNNGWIPCEKEMPPVETEVWIVAKRKRRDGTYKYITTTAMYEDGTVLENDSCWRWEDIEGEWNEEEDCYIIPEGWWENKLQRIKEGRKLGLDVLLQMQ